MPAQPFDPSADERAHDHHHDADHEIFDEDSLREDQPYADLEDERGTTGTQESPEPDGSGSGSW
jgi:hypothetical protein